MEPRSLCLEREGSLTQSAVDVGKNYRWYVVWLLFFVYVLNFVDRQILIILMEPIRLEFGFSDKQLGLLGGLAFALLYSTIGIPIARLADRANRVNIIAISVCVWSLATAVTALARNFTQLLIARVVVGVGRGLVDGVWEGDFLWLLGADGGIFVGYLVGALVAEQYGWRAAFWVVGAPGVLLAIVVKLTLREPPRGFSDEGEVAAAPPPVTQVLGRLANKRAFQHLALAAALHAFVGYGVTGFHPSFLIRTHGFSVAEVGMILSFVAATSGLGGTWFGGYLADRFTNARSDVRWQLWVPGVATLINVPVALLAYTASDRNIVVALLFISLVFGVMYLAPTFAAVQRLVDARERALGSALLLLIINLLGLGLGPYLVGMVSDILNQNLLANGYTAVDAKAQGLRSALTIMVCVNLWSFLHYMLAARTFERDSVA